MNRVDAERWAYIGSLTMDPFGVAAGIHRDEDPWSRDPVDECCHGRLSGDRTDPCGCWLEEGAVIHRPVFAMTREGEWRRAA